MHGLPSRGRRARWAERRRLKRQDALSSRLAELRAIGALLEQAAEVVEAGWVQGAWFTVATPGGDRAVTAYDMGLAVTQPVTGACLVGAVVQAAGGPAEVRSQLVQRSLDLAWHALREDPGSAGPVVSRSVRAHDARARADLLERRPRDGRSVRSPTCSWQPGRSLTCSGTCAGPSRRSWS